MTLVIDASVAIKWLVEEEGSDAAEALRSDSLAAPDLIRIEVANALRTFVARGELAPDAASDLFALFQRAPVVIHPPDEALERRALALAVGLAHPVYDCLYLALAERLGATLVTADRRVLRALAGTPFDSRARPLLA